MLLVKAPPREQRLLGSLSLGDIVLVIGLAAMIIPTMFGVAKVSWTTEQGGHGPIVLATGIWLLWRELKDSKAERERPSWWIGGPPLAACLIVYILGRVTGIIEFEALAMYGALISTAYLLLGGPLLRSIWFPLLYLALTLPPPDSVVAWVTQPVKIAISDWAVALLHALGYPIASSGVTIQIAQYELLVAAACAGLNSIISLAAICLFYVYLRHRTNLTAFFVTAAAVVPVAIFSNFVRVLILILITYYMGEAAAQGFLHDFAGLTMFAVALFTIFAVDSVYTRLSSLRRARVVAA